MSPSVLNGALLGAAHPVLGLGEGLDETADVSPSVLNGALLGAAHPVLGLGEGLLDRIEVWRLVYFPAQN